jgi:hypothetical protein
MLHLLEVKLTLHEPTRAEPAELVFPVLLSEELEMCSLEIRQVDEEATLHVRARCGPHRKNGPGFSTSLQLELLVPDTKGRTAKTKIARSDGGYTELSVRRR